MKASSNKIDESETIANINFPFFPYEIQPSLLYNAYIDGHFYCFKMKDDSFGNFNFERRMSEGKV